MHAQQRVELDELGLGAQALTVGRVADEQAGHGAGGRRLEGVAALDPHTVRKARTREVVAGRGDGARIEIAPGDRRLQPPGAASRNGFVADALPQHRLVVEPVLEAPATTQQAGRDVGGHPRALDQQGAGPAHGVEQRCPTRGGLGPAGLQQDCRGEVLLERRLDAVAPVSAPVQAVARQVQAQRRVLAFEMQMDADVGVLGVDVRSRLAAVAEVIGDRVLDLESGEVRMGESGRAAGDLDRETRRGREQPGPVDRPRGGVQGIRIRGLEALQRQQHATRQPRPQAGAVSRLERGAGGDAAAAGFEGVETQRREFGGEQGFDAARAADEQGEDGHAALSQATAHAARDEARSLGGRNTRGCDFAISAIFRAASRPIVPLLASNQRETSFEMALPRLRGSYRPGSWASARRQAARTSSLKQAKVACRSEVGRWARSSRTAMTQAASSG